MQRSTLIYSGGICKFVEQWNKIGLLLNPKRELITLETDASGNWGCGGVWDSHWLQWEWNSTVRQWSIAPKEI